MKTSTRKTINENSGVMTFEKPQTKEVANSLKHTIYTKDIDGNVLDITIRLSDDCKNGHNDFAITASAYDIKGKGSRADKWYLYGGCAHNEILKVRPDLKIFVDLHLSDFRGVPMYAVENGFYHLHNSKPSVAQEHARCTDDEFAILMTAKDKEYYGHLLVELGIVERWRQQAQQAIAMLEEMTGKTFVDNSTKLPPMPMRSAEVEKRIKEGYYTTEAIAEREKQKEIEHKLKLKNKLIHERDKDLDKINREFNVKMCVLNGGLSLDNFIYYNHTNEATFNWYDGAKKVTQVEFDAFVANVQDYWPDEFAAVPDEIKFKLGTKGK